MKNGWADLTTAEVEKMGTALFIQTAKHSALLDLWVEISDKVNNGELTAEQGIHEMNSKSLMYVMDSLQMWAAAGDQASLLQESARKIRDKYEGVGF